MPINYTFNDVFTSGNITAHSGIFDHLSVSGIPVSVSGHIHSSSDITDFNSSVSGLLPVKDIVAGTGIGISSTSGIYTINSTVSGVAESASLVTNVFNKTANTINKGSVVYINGGQGDQPTIQLAIASTEMGSSKTYGIVQSNIPSMSVGKVVVAGALTAFNTDQYNPTAPHGDVNGTTLWLSPSVSGAMTTTKPSAPYHMVSVGTIVRTHQNEGVIEVRIQNGYELEELHNVAISGVTNGQFLQYNGSGLWVPSSNGKFNEIAIGSGSKINYHDNDGTLDFYTYQMSSWGKALSLSYFGGIVFPDNTVQNTAWTNSISSDNVEYAGGYSSLGSNITDSVDYLYLNKSDITHGHGNINFQGKIGSTSGLLVVTGSGGLLTTSSGINSNLITNFNSSVSGLLPSVSGSGYVSSTLNNNIYTISVSGLQPSGNYSLVGHTHTSSEITDFNSVVSGLLPVTNIVGGNNITVSQSGTVYSVAVTGSLGLTTEEVDDRVASLLVAGSGINLNYNDNNNTLTVSVSGLTSSAIIGNGSGNVISYNLNEALNVVGSGSTTVTYNDSTNTINISSPSLIREYELVNSTKSTFTVTGGYALNNLDVYHNGIKLLASGDYTATNGSTFDLIQPAVSGDVVEWLGYSVVPRHQLILGEVRSDTVGNINYLGRAVAGSSEASAVWTIKRYTIADNGIDITTSTASSAIWNNRLTETYL